MDKIDPDFLLKLLVIVAAAVVLANGIKQLISKTKVEPQPFEVRAATEYATREELARVEQEVRSLGEKIGKLPGELNQQSEHRIDRVHVRIDEMKVELAGLPDRIIAQLANLGVLKRS